MPITRSTWIDDDGSGQTGTIINNAELQKIYANIDAQVVTGVWTPTDTSGAGLYVDGCDWPLLEAQISSCGCRRK